MGLGYKILCEYFKPGDILRTGAAQRAADAVDVAIAAAVQRGFRLGFEHAVAGGEECSKDGIITMPEE
jgi:hypothetical protein